jgi:hypothetical protein
VGYTANVPLDALFDKGPMVKTVTRITGRVGDLLTDTVKRKTPVADLPPGVTPEMRGRVPGTLKESWYTSDVERIPSRTGGEARAVESLTDDPVAPHVEYPTRPHLIRPRLDRAPASVTATGKPRRMGGDPQAALRFINAFGQVVYAHEIWHPGTQGTHMMRDALAEIEGTWVTEVGDREVAAWAREQAELVR